MEKDPGVKYQQARDIVSQTQRSADEDSTFLDVLGLMSLTSESVPVDPSTRTYSALDVFIRKVAPRAGHRSSSQDGRTSSMCPPTSPHHLRSMRFPQRRPTSFKRCAVLNWRCLRTFTQGKLDTPVTLLLRSSRTSPMSTLLCSRTSSKKVVIAGFTHHRRELHHGQSNRSACRNCSHKRPPTKRSWFSALGIRDIAKYDPIKMWERTGEMFTDVPLGMVTRDRSSRAPQSSSCEL